MVENILVLFSLVYFVKVIHQREVIENFAESVQCSGTISVELCASNQSC